LLTAPSTSRPTPYLTGVASANGLRDRYSSGGTTYGHRARQYSQSPLSSVSSLGHSRNQSLTDLPSPLPIKVVPRTQGQPKRSSSALGSFAGGLSSLERSASLRGVRSQEVMRESRLQSWMEESPLRQEVVEPVRTSSQASHHSRTASIESSVRPTSALDLRTQMDELKGRISSLRERAQEDKVKRLSINSMRTPSPFSTSEQWYTDGEAYKNHALSTDAGIGWSPNQSPIALHTDHEFPSSKSSDGKLKPNVPIIHSLETEYAESHYQDAEETLDDLEEESRKADEKAILTAHRLSQIQNDVPAELEDDKENESDGDEQDVESTEGGSEYYEAVPVLGERHEDRADAFDYEHFFLHSAMGSFTRERSNSFSSEDSIETTRPVSPKRPATAVQTPQDVERSPSLHHRSQSYDSISSAASFQTAVEGNESDSDNSEGSPDPISQTSTINNVNTTNTVTNGNTSPRRKINGNAFSHTPPNPEVIFRDNDRPLSTLISSFLEKDTLSREPSALLQQDRELVGNVFQSLKDVCNSLQGFDSDDYERRAWRRRLDAARRALDGEFEATAL
jgi:hypothetical protein